MNTRRTRTIVMLIVVAATLFVARPAHGAGGVVWSAPVNDCPRDLAADARGVVVVTSNSTVQAVDREGHERWHVHVDGLVPAQPAVGRDLVVVSAGSSVTALSRSAGARRWQAPTTDEVHSLALVADTAIAGDDSGALTAFDARTGEIRWSVQFSGMLWSGARIDRATGSVVATWHQSPTPAVRVFDLATGTLRWEAPTARFTAAPAVHHGVVVLAIGDGNRHARVEARVLASGALRWQTPVPASFEEAIELAVDDHDAAVVDHFGVVSLLDVGTGKLRWQSDVAHALLRTRVVLTPFRVAFTSFSGDVFVLDRRHGRLVARLGPRRLDGYPVATVRSPWHGRGRLLVALRLRAWGVQLRRLP
jgi:outer membrane protein assembly factor BamB